MTTTDYHYPNEVISKELRTPYWGNVAYVENAEPWEGAIDGSDPTGHPRAYVTVPSLKNTDTIAGSDYGFTIPLNARITGITSTLYWSGQYIEDYYVTFEYNGASLSNKRSNTSDMNGLLNVKTYGSSTDKWGAPSLLPSLVNDSGFTFKMNVYNPHPAAKSGYLYSMPVKITYTEPSYEIINQIPTHVLIDSYFNYTITLTSTNNIDNGEPIPVDVPIPEGLTYIDHTCDGTYDPVTEEWLPTLQTVGSTKRAEITLYVQASTVGVQSQTVTETEFSTTDTSTCTVVASDSDDIYIVNAPITDTTTLNNLEDGKEYILSAYHRVHDTGVVGIWDEGIRNNRIAIINGDEVQGTRPSAQDTWVRDSVIFTYNSAETLTFRLYGQYESVSDVGEDQWAGFVLKEHILGVDDAYDDGSNLLSDPDALLGDVSTSTLTLPDTSQSGVYEFTTDVIAEPDGVNPYFTGFELLMDVADIVGTGVIVQIENSQGVISETKTQNYTLEDTPIILGDSDDLWGLTSENIANETLTVKILFSTYSTGTTATYSNLRLILYSDLDETFGNYGFTINGVHSRNYKIFLKPEVDISEGPKQELEILSLPKVDGDLITNQKLKSKEIEMEFLIWGDTIEEARENLRLANLFLSNERDLMYYPIPNELIFDADPTRSYLVVQSEPIEVTRKYTTLECVTKFIVPSGVAKNVEATVTGAIGTNNGIISVKPVISVVTDGSSTITLTDTVSGQEIELNDMTLDGDILYLDCDNRTAYTLDVDLTPTYYTDKVNIDTVWFNFITDYDITAVGCTVENVTYYESY